MSVPLPLGMKRRLERLPPESVMEALVDWAWARLVGRAPAEPSTIRGEGNRACTCGASGKGATDQGG